MLVLRPELERPPLYTREFVYVYMPSPASYYFTVHELVRNYAAPDPATAAAIGDPRHILLLSRIRSYPLKQEGSYISFAAPHLK